MDFQVELRLRIRKLLPGFADLPRLLFGIVLGRAADDDGAGLQCGGSAQDTIPQVIGCNDGQSNRFPALFRHGKRLREQMLLDAAEELIGIQFVFPGRRTPQQPHVQHDNVPAPRLDAVENITKVIQIEVVADRDQDIPWPRADRFRAQLAFQLEIELIHFHVSDPAVSGAALGNGEHDVQDYRKDTAGHGGYRLGEQVRYRDQEQRERNQSEAHRNLHASEIKIERNLELALARSRITQNQHRQAIHREAPDHSESVQVREESNIAAADQNGENLQAYDDGDNSIAGPKARMRLPKPFRQHTIFRNAIQYAVGTDDRSVHCPGENDRTHDHDKSVKDQAGNRRSFKVHGQAADKVLQVILPDIIRDDHHREKGHQRGEHQAVDENDQARFFQVFQLGALYFAIHLRERFFSAHGQHGVPERDKDGHHAELRQSRVRKPAERAGTEVQIAWIRKGRKRRVPQHGRVNAPADQQHHHHGDQLHDVEGFFAGFGYTLCILPPEINGDDNGEGSGDASDRGFRKRSAQVSMLREITEQAAKVLSGRYTADWPGEDVVEHQRGNAEFRQRPAQRLLDRAVHPATHEHTAAFYIHRAHGVREKHDGQDEPGCGLADVPFGL